MDAIDKLRALITGRSAETLKELAASRLLEKTDPVAPKAPANNREMFHQVKQEVPLLGAIAAAESSGGLNTNHAFDPKSGTKAGGMFAVMPRTAYDALKRNKELSAKYPDLTQAAQKDDHGAFTKAFNSDPAIAREFAEEQLKFLQGATQDPSEIAYAWLNGRQGMLNKRREGFNFNEHDYVKKVNKELKKKSAPKQNVPMKDLETAPAQDYAEVDVLKQILKGNNYGQ